jgi:protein-disulfide isomerase
VGAAQNKKRTHTGAEAPRTTSNQPKRNPGKASAAKTLAAARGANNDRRNIAIGVAVVIVVAVAVIVAVIVTSGNGNQAKPPVNTGNADAIAVTKAPSEYSATVLDDGTVVAGPDTAKVKLDVYEDFLCPYCDQLEQATGAQTAKAMADGKLQIRYHLVNLLDAHSVPPGYSTQAANAAIAAAKQGKFADFHASLYAQQPEEGGPGYTNAQLLSLGKRLGITAPQFTTDVNTNAYGKLVQQQYNAAFNPPLSLNGTPTVRNGNTTINTATDPQWLDKLLN